MALTPLAMWRLTGSPMFTFHLKKFSYKIATTIANSFVRTYSVIDIDSAKPFAGARW
jgi:hypothetical protein